MKKEILLIILAVMLISTSFLLFQADVKAHPNTINVPNDYPTIQEAINAANSGDTITISPKTYVEQVVVNKSVSLVGENKSTTIIDGNNSAFTLHIVSSNVNVTGLTLRNAGKDEFIHGCGILLSNVSNCSIYDCILDNSYYGAKLNSCINIKITNTLIIKNLCGVCLESSVNCVMSGNTIYNNMYFGFKLSFSSNCQFSNNTVERTNYGFQMHFSDDCAINSSIVRKTVYHGVYLNSSSNIDISNNNVSDNYHVGISILKSHGCIATNNTVNFDSNIGIRLYLSSKCKINENNLTYSNTGISLEHSTYCIISNNRIVNCSYGVQVNSANISKVTRNMIGGNSYGLRIHSSKNCTLNANTVKNNFPYGICLYNSTENYIFHNNMVNNNVQMFTINSANFLNESVEGNYWSDYAGKDENFDGIGDIPYRIDENNIDNHPLMGMFSSFNTSLGYHVYIISNSTISNFTFNKTGSTIRFNVSGDEGIGFCRVCIPRNLISPPYTVLIDNGLTSPLFVNYTLHANGTHNWIYFAFPHTTREVTITPEYSPLIFLLFFIILTLSVTVLVKKK